MRAPFIKIFDTETHTYAYDVHSNEIMRVTPLMGKVLSELGTTPTWEIPDKLGLTHDPAEIHDCLVEIESLRSESGLLSSDRPVYLRFPLEKEELREKLTNGLKLLTLGVTECCNLRCRYCTYSGKYTNSRAHTATTMTFETARKAIDLYLGGSRDEPERGIGFYGGEPLLAFDLIRKVIAYVNGMDLPKPVSFHLTTNGLLLERAAVRDYLVGNDIQILISLDGPAWTHDRMRRDRHGESTHAKIMAGIRHLQREQPGYIINNVGFSVCVTNGESLEQARSFFLEHGDLCESGLMVVALIDPTDSTLLDEGIVQRDWDQTVASMVQDYLDCLFEGRTPEPFLRGLLSDNFARIRSHIHQRPLERLSTTPPPGGICIPGCQRLFCTSSGDFTLCERINDTLTIGNVDSGIDVDRVWEIVSRYAEISSPDCTSCWALRFCGLCFLELYDHDFNLERKRRYCDLERDRWLQNLKLYCSARERKDDVFNTVEAQTV